MARKEEIKEEALFNCNDIAGEVDYKSTAAYEGFIKGAKWADETMIDKACEWLSKTLYIHKEEIEDKHWNMTETFEWVTSDYDSVGDFINAFKKAMEE